MAARVRGAGLTLPAASLAASSPPQAPPPRPAGPPVDDDLLTQTTATVLAAGIRCVVWDFDLTILAIHSYGEHIAATAVPFRSLESDFRDLAFFRRLVPQLQRNGIACAIASFGKYEVIQAYMTRAFAEAADEATGDGAPGAPSAAALASATALFNRHNILTPSTLGLTDGCSMREGKNKLLAHLCSSSGLAPAQLLFFDDDRSNIGWAAAAGFPFSLHTPGGFHSGPWLEAVAAFFRPGGGPGGDGAAAAASGAAGAGSGAIGLATAGALFGGPLGSGPGALVLPPGISTASSSSASAAGFSASSASSFSASSARDPSSFHAADPLESARLAAAAAAASGSAGTSAAGHHAGTVSHSSGIGAAGVLPVSYRLAAPATAGSSGGGAAGDFASPAGPTGTLIASATASGAARSVLSAGSAGIGAAGAVFSPASGLGAVAPVGGSGFGGLRSPPGGVRPPMGTPVPGFDSPQPEGSSDAAAGGCEAPDSGDPLPVPAGGSAGVPAGGAMTAVPAFGVLGGPAGVGGPAPGR